MDSRLLLSTLLVMFFCNIFVIKGISTEEAREIASQIENAKNPSVTMSLTLDEAAEAFGTPTREELTANFEKEVKEQERRRSVSSYAHTVLANLIGFFTSYFRS